MASLYSEIRFDCFRFFVYICLTVSEPSYGMFTTDFQKLNFTRQQGGDNTFRISPTDNAVKFIF
ncbi:MAG: hypothetical protein BWK80_26600 [Desulfobacteraceae bacterium IS3]|nr:MAG: hypothetical protein BWK80_26600 [Desulfobacteraceae bacterium IS3]